MANIKNKTVEVEAKTVEEAVEKALGLFNVKRDQLEIKVLSEERKGLFGMEGAKPAKIRATLIDKSSKKA